MCNFFKNLNFDLGDLLSFVASIIAVFYTWSSTKKRIEIEILNQHSYTEFPKYDYFFIDCIIHNKSSNFISINDIFLLYNKNKIQSKSINLTLGEEGLDVLGYNYISYKSKSRKLPFKLKPYDSIKTTLIFDNCDCKNFSLLFRTSRGEVYLPYFIFPIKLSKFVFKYIKKDK